MLSKTNKTVDSQPFQAAEITAVFSILPRMYAKPSDVYGRKTKKSGNSWKSSNDQRTGAGKVTATIKNGL
jgi:hypothetical protein